MTVATHWKPPRRYFLDESGVVGDLAAQRQPAHLNKQPVFVLAAIGGLSEPDFEAIAEALRVRHRLQMSELSAVDLRRRPVVMAEAVNLLLDAGAVIVLELVECRFAVAVQVVERLLGAPINRTRREQALLIAFAERIAQETPEVLDQYLKACRDGGDMALKAALDGLVSRFQSISDPVAAQIGARAATRRSRLLGPLSAEERDALLPVPERGRNGKALWIHPATPSFSNIYARVNKIEPQGLVGVELVHDAQAYSQMALEDAKAVLEERPRRVRLNPSPSSDFTIRQGAKLTFLDSKSVVGLQLADLVAGLAMRLARAHARGEDPPPPLQRAICRLIEVQPPPLGAGINLVTSSGLARAIVGSNAELV